MPPGTRRESRRYVWLVNKTAPVPPAVRAPVFPQASPVTEGLKLAILRAGRRVHCRGSTLDFASTTVLFCHCDVCIL
jgi:hypothetical protein